ncbi:hypothetical protein [Bradyrhizobium sp. CCGB20]|nr:hypothetical protein [Bradyrhizobium sp. CCGB20]
MAQIIELVRSFGKGAPLRVGQSLPQRSRNTSREQIVDIAG